MDICVSRELEELLQEHSVLFTTWRSSLVVQLVLQNLVIVSILFNRLGDVEKIAFDRYLVGRVQERPTDVVFTKRHLILVFLGTPLWVATLFNIIYLIFVCLGTPKRIYILCQIPIFLPIILKFSSKLNSNYLFYYLLLLFEWQLYLILYISFLSSTMIFHVKIKMFVLLIL